MALMHCAPELPACNGDGYWLLAASVCTNSNSETGECHYAIKFLTVYKFPLTANGTKLLVAYISVPNSLCGASLFEWSTTIPFPYIPNIPILLGDEERVVGLEIGSNSSEATSHVDFC